MTAVLPPWHTPSSSAATMGDRDLLRQVIDADENHWVNITDELFRAWTGEDIWVKRKQLQFQVGGIIMITITKIIMEKKGEYIIILMVTILLYHHHYYCYIIAIVIIIIMYSPLLLLLYNHHYYYYIREWKSIIKGPFNRATLVPSHL